MSLNLTLLGQMLTFILFIWFTMKFVWPPLTKLMAERQQQIADGLAAAEQGQKELELAQRQRQDILTDAKAKASTIVEQATHRANHIVEEAKKRSNKFMGINHQPKGRESTSTKNPLIPFIFRL